MILKKIPERAINKLGMDREVARPEGLIMKCVPIPPNCTRTTDYKYVNNTTAVQFGSVCTGPSVWHPCFERIPSFMIDSVYILWS